MPFVIDDAFYCLNLRYLISDPSFLSGCDLIGNRFNLIGSAYGLLDCLFSWSLLLEVIKLLGFYALLLALCSSEFGKRISRICYTLISLIMGFNLLLQKKCFLFKHVALDILI